MKKLLQAITALLITLTVYPQTFTLPSYASVDTNYRTYVNQVFGQLEASLVNKKAATRNDLSITKKLYAEIC